MPYTYLKVLHIIAVVIFLGNIFTGIFWMHIAFKSKDMAIIHHTIKGVLKSDRLFTIPGVIFIVAAGIWTATSASIPLLRTSWILWSFILFTLSGISFVWKIEPLQKRILRLSQSPETADESTWKLLKDAHLQWELWGLFALFTPLCALVMMTLKIPK
jgi:uncharacterized membrane protein